jgi:hypothetical protein
METRRFRPLASEKTRIYVGAQEKRLFTSIKKALQLTDADLAKEIIGFYIEGNPDIKTFISQEL